MDSTAGDSPYNPQTNLCRLVKFEIEFKSKIKMAIYHFSVKNISRGDGRSAVACAAYRSGEKLEDCYQGKFQDYTQKTGVEYTEIYAPKNTNDKLLNRQNLWNAVEQVERRKDAILAREFEIAFPCEFDSEQRKQLLDDLCFKIVKEYNVIVDAAIHAPHTSSGSDERNYHAHIMFTARAIDLENGDFSKKKYRDFNREIREEIIDNQKIKKVVGVETVKHWRESFADLTNQHLEANDIKSRVDHRSYKDQGTELEATQHEGVAVTALRRQYAAEQEKPIFERNLEIVMPKIALENDAIKALNTETTKNDQIIKGLDQEILLSEMTIQKLRDQDLIQKTEEQKKQKENEQNLKQTSQNYFREVFSAIVEAKKLRAAVHKFEEEYENDYTASVRTDCVSLNHKTYQAHQKMMSLVQRYEQHANTHNFLSLRDRTIAYLESKKQEKKDLGMMAFLTKPKELKNLNDSIKRIADLFNYFSDMAKDFKQNPFMKSIHSDFFYKEQEIKKEKEYKQSSQEYFEESQRRGEHLRKLLAADEKRRFNENQLRYKKETEEYHAKKAQKQAQKPDEPIKKPVDRSNDFER